MAFGFGSKNTLPIGVDLGYSAVRLAQVRRGKGAMELVGAAKDNVPAHIRDDPTGRLGFFSHHLPRLLKSGDFEGRKCVLGFPAECTFVRHLKVPNLEGRELDAAIRREAREELPYPVDQAILQHLDVGEVFSGGKTMKEVIAVAIPTNTMDAYLDMLTRSDLQVVAVNIGPVAMVECFAEVFSYASDESQAILYVAMGCSSTQVVIARGRRITFARNMPYGTDQADRLIAQKLDISLEVAGNLRRNPDLQMGRDVEGLERVLEPWLGGMEKEIQRSLLYFNSLFHESTVSRVIFSGDQARDKLLSRGLAARLNISPQIGDPMEGIQAGSKLPASFRSDMADQTGYTVAIGLSICGRQGI